MLSDLAASSNSVNDSVGDGSSVITITSRIDEDQDLNPVEPDPILVAKLIRETREMLRSGTKNNYYGNGREAKRAGQGRF